MSSKPIKDYSLKNGAQTIGVSRPIAEIRGVVLSDPDGRQKTVAEIIDGVGAVAGKADTAAMVEALAGKVDKTDPALTNARTPTAHAASHATGGTDPITPASIGATTAIDIANALNAKITYGTTELTPGTSPLANGVLHLVYE